MRTHLGQRKSRLSFFTTERDVLVPHRTRRYQPTFVFVLVVSIVAFAVQGACSFRSGLEGSKCDAEGERRDGYVCRSGYWVETDSKPEGPTDSEDCPSPPCGPHLDTTSGETSGTGADSSTEGPTDTQNGGEEDALDTVPRDTRRDAPRDTAELDAPEDGEVEPDADIKRTVCTEDPGSSSDCVCDAGETCDIECNGSNGGCNVRCRNDSDCTVTCETGRCDIRCEADVDSCTINCENGQSGGPCIPKCETTGTTGSGEPRCEVNCRGDGSCDPACEGNASCAVNCESNGQCTPECGPQAERCDFNCKSSNEPGTCNPNCSEISGTCTVDCQAPELPDDEACVTACPDPDSCNAEEGSCQLSECATGERESTSDNNRCFISCASD